jgi:hypothetical protein
VEVIDYSHVPEVLIPEKMPQVHVGLDLGWSQGGTKISSLPLKEIARPHPSYDTDWAIPNE